MISAITSNSQNLQNWQLMQQRRHDFQNLGSSLQTGNRSGAQQASPDLQALFTTPPSNATPSATAGTASNNSIQQDFAAIGQDLGTGNLAQAQKDYSQMRNDIQSVLSQNAGIAGMHHHARHHLHASSTDGSSTSTSSTGTSTTAANTLTSAAGGLFAQYANPTASSSAPSRLLSMFA